MGLKPFRTFTNQRLNEKQRNNADKSGAENYNCSGKVYSPFRVKRSKRTGKFTFSSTK